MTWLARFCFIFFYKNLNIYYFAITAMSHGICWYHWISKFVKFIYKTLMETKIISNWKHSNNFETLTMANETNLKNIKVGQIVTISIAAEGDYVGTVDLISSDRNRIHVSKTTNFSGYFFVIIYFCPFTSVSRRYVLSIEAKIFWNKKILFTRDSVDQSCIWCSERRKRRNIRTGICSWWSNQIRNQFERERSDSDIDYESMHNQNCRWRIR